MILKRILEETYHDNGMKYRFSVISNRNNKMLGTGFFKSSRKMTTDEQLNFFHQYTHGKYQKEESFVSIDIFEAEV